MEDQPTVEPTTADERTIHDIYKEIKDAPQEAEPEVEPEDVTPEGQAEDKPKEEAPEDDSLDTEDEQDAVDERIAAAIKDLPDNAKAPIEKLLSEQKKGVEKLVKQTQEERDWARGWKEALTNPATAKDALGQLISEVERVTGKPRTELVGSPAPTSEPHLDPKNLSKWSEFKDERGDPVYASQKEMELAVQVHELRTSQQTQAEEARKFFQEQRDKEARMSKEKEESDWLTGNAPKIINEVTRQLSGWVVSKDMVKVALNGQRPTSRTEAVALIKAKFADEYIAHSLQAKAPPAKKREMVAAGGAKGVHLDIPSDPNELTAHDVYARIKAQRRTG